MRYAQPAARVHQAARKFRALNYSLRSALDSDAAAVKACVHAAYRHYIERMGRKPGPMLADYAEVIRGRQVTVADSGGIL